MKRIITSVLTRPCKFIWRIGIELKVFQAVLGIVVFCITCYIACLPMIYIDQSGAGFLCSLLVLLFEVLCICYIADKWDTIKDVWGNTK